MLGRLLARGRFLVTVAVAGVFFSGTALLVYGAVETVLTIEDLVAAGPASWKEAKDMAVTFVDLIDVFLIATVLYVIAFGLFELFVDDRIPLPAWLEIHDLDDLKDRLIRVVVVALAVLFLGEVVGWDGETDLLRFGAAIALVIAALAYFTSRRITPEGRAGP